MAQTSNAVTQSCGQVEISSDGAAWTDISGVTQSMTPGVQTLMSGEAYTLDGDTAIVKGGKREPMESEFIIVYSEADAEGYEQSRAIFEASDCGNTAYVRYSPAGGNANDEQLTSGEGTIISFTYPPVDAANAGPILAGFTIKHNGFTTAIISS
jgi:hypothetical protein